MIKKAMMVTLFLGLDYFHPLGVPVSTDKNENEINPKLFLAHYFGKVIRKKFSWKIVLDSNGKIFIMETLECGTKMMLILLVLRKHSKIAH